VAHDQPLATGSHVKVLCKPEQLRLDPAGELRGVLSAAAYLGSVIQYQVDVGSTNLEVVMPAGDGGFEVGTSVGIDPSGHALRLIEA
jgi:ABC-type Fe3+/spermidine/putrescine transport system ATPase subunit